MRSVLPRVLSFGGAALLLCASMLSNAQTPDWPPVTSETRPWTRWWWQGSAVDEASLTAELEALRAAGIGGVEITPIYGVRGAESRFIPYLSDALGAAARAHAARSAAARTSASTWPPAPAGRSADRGSAT